jgi:carboxylate-amine ligase
MEEEYLLVDPETRDLMIEPPPAFLKACEDELGGRVSPEFMQCQIEVGTPVCRSIAELRREIVALRDTVCSVSQAHGLAVIAASTHPFACWRPQRPTVNPRYDKLAAEMGTPVRRLLISAMHMHVGIEDPNLRIDLMNQVRYFLPHLLSLTTSSPFWRGQDTGLKSYRLAVFNEMPRNGTPEQFVSYGEYEQHLQALIDVGAIEDGTKLWWDIRPSARFPTLEMRICDICTSVEDGITVAALYACILRMLWRLKRDNVQWRRYKTMLLNENRWRAMRYGIDGRLIDFGRRQSIAFPELMEEILDLTEKDAEALDCVAEVRRAREILARGTSAHQQVATYERALADGATESEAQQAVVDWLIRASRPE